jgi:hypothetical protein
MKTFSQFLLEATTTQRLKMRAAQLVAKHKDNPEKLEIDKIKDSFLHLECLHIQKKIIHQHKQKIQRK